MGARRLGDRPDAVLDAGALRLQRPCARTVPARDLGRARHLRPRAMAASRTTSSISRSARTRSRMSAIRFSCAPSSTAWPGPATSSPLAPSRAELGGVGRPARRLVSPSVAGGGRRRPDRVRLKPHVIHANPSFYFPAGVAATLSAQEQVEYLFWDGGFEYGERFFPDAAGLDAYLESPVAATSRSAARANARQVTAVAVARQLARFR